MKKITIALLVFLCLKVSGQTQYLDTNFNQSGYLVTDYWYKSYDETGKIKLMSDHSIIATSYTNITDYLYYKSGLSVLKLNPNNGFNADFGNLGKVINNFDSYQIYTSPKDLIEYDDGRLLFLTDKGLIKTEANGKLDSLFAFNGKQEIFSGATNKILKLSDGKFYTFGGNTTDLYIEKFTQDGFSDFSFGNKGVQVYDFGDYENIADAILLNDGKILLAANSTKQVTVNNTTKYRYNILKKINQDGSVDPNFNFEYIMSDYYSAGSLRKMIIDPVSNYAYVILHIQDCNDNILVVDLNTGNLVKTFFDVSGYFPCWNGKFFDINDIAFYKGKLLLAGSQYSSSSKDLWIGSYNLDGSMNTNFANNGSFKNTFSNAILKNIQISEDGSIYGGATYNDDILVFKLLNNIMLNVDNPSSERNITLAYPNPVKNTLNVRIKNTQNKNLDISVYDLSGRFIRNGLNGKNTNSSGDLILDLSFLKQGNYVLKFSGENYSESIKIIKK